MGLPSTITADKRFAEQITVGVNAAAATATAAMDMGDFKHASLFTVPLTGSGTGWIMTIQGSEDQSTWATIAGATAGDGVSNNLHPFEDISCRYIRALVTTLSTGAQTLIVVLQIKH
jgi:hypothetical protein